MRIAGFRLLLALLSFVPAGGAAALDMQFTTSDGVKLHFIDAGPRGAPTIVFVPGWTMPAWIFKPQLDYFARRYHVVALDPRGQGESEAPADGYNYVRRGKDIAELIAALAGRPVVLVGWSLGVLDSLSYATQFGDGHLAGMVLIDNSVGEDPPPLPGRPLPLRRGPRLARAELVRRFVAGMFRVSPGEAYLAALTEASLNTPPEAAAQLSSYPVPRIFWKDAVLSISKPVLYVVRPRFSGQAGNLALDLPGTETAVFTQAGHALFVDEAPRFDLLMDSFIKRRIWP